MHLSVKQFFAQVPREVFAGKKILEVGSLDINGSIKPAVMANEPASFLGIDFMDGPRVDQVVDAENLVDTFGKDSFDVVVSAEMLEHAEHWRECINNMKQVAREYIVITTRGPGFGWHAYPHDYWRYTVADMKAIFRDWDILRLKEDPQAPGVFLIARNKGAPLADLSGIQLKQPEGPKPK